MTLKQLNLVFFITAKQGEILSSYVTVMASFTRAVNKDISKSIGYRLDLSMEKVIFLSLVDFLFTQTWVNLLSTASWRGVWNLLDIFLAGDSGLWKVSCSYLGWFFLD